MAVRRRLLLVWLLYLTSIATCVYVLVSYHPSLLDPDRKTAAAAAAAAAASVRAGSEAAGGGRVLPQCNRPLRWPPTSSTPMLDIWIVAGQSNAVGDNWRDPSPIPDASAPAGEAILSFTPEGRWAAAQPNIHLGVHNFSQPDSVGPDMSFARTLITEGLATRVGLVPTAKCNTDLYRDWRPGSGPYYQHMVATVDAALAAAAAGNWERPRLAGMIWVQGESDAVADTTPSSTDTAESAGGTGATGTGGGSGGSAREAGAESVSKVGTYAANLHAFVSAVRSHFAPHHPCLPIVLGVLSSRQASPKLPHISSIRQIQLDLQDPAIIKADMDRHSLFRYNGVTLHLSKQGQSTFGVEMAEAYKAWVAHERALTQQLDKAARIKV